MSVEQNRQKSLLPGYKSKSFLIKEGASYEPVILSLDRDKKFAMFDAQLQEVFAVDFMEAVPSGEQDDFTFSFLIDRKAYSVLVFPEKMLNDMGMSHSDEQEDYYEDYVEALNKHTRFTSAYEYGNNNLLDAFRGHKAGGATDVEEGQWLPLFNDKEGTIASLEDTLDSIDFNDPKYNQKFEHPGYLTQDYLMRYGIGVSPVNVVLTTNGRFIMNNQKGKEIFNIDFLKVGFEMDEAKGNVTFMVDGKKYTVTSNHSFASNFSKLLFSNYFDHLLSLEDYQAYLVRMDKEDKILDNFFMFNGYLSEGPIRWKYVFENRKEVLASFQ